MENMTKIAQILSDICTRLHEETGGVPVSIQLDAGTFSALTYEISNKFEVAPLPQSVLEHGVVSIYTPVGVVRVETAGRV